MLPFASLIWMLWPPTPESSWLKSMPKAWSAGASSWWTSNATFWAVTLSIVAPGGSDAAGPLGAGVEPPTVPDQHAGNGVELGAGLYVGSTQPLKVLTLPSAPMTGSLSDGSL